MKDSFLLVVSVCMLKVVQNNLNELLDTDRDQESTTKNHYIKV